MASSTHILIPVLHKCITAWLAFHQAGLVEQKVEFGDSAELVKDLQECISGGQMVRLFRIIGIEEQDALVDGGVEIAYVEPIFEELARLLCRWI